MGGHGLRQCAVMQQVFSVLKMLLAESAASSHRRLVIRIYRVVVLSQPSSQNDSNQVTLPAVYFLPDIMFVNFADM